MLEADAAPGVAPRPGDLVNLDCEGHVIENSGLASNLMIVHALEMLTFDTGAWYGARRHLARPDAV
jgi:hypothetical protein